MRVNVNGFRSIYATTPPDQLPHGMSRPQHPRHLHLVMQQHANFYFLLLTQVWAWVHRSGDRLVLQSSRIFASVVLANIKYARARQIRMLNNLVVGLASRAQV
ncbi:MAG: hypothetical protein VB140_03105 [Burkholderia sp.]